MNVAVARMWARLDGTCDGVGFAFMWCGHWRLGLAACALGWVLFVIGHRKSFP